MALKEKFEKLKNDPLIRTKVITFTTMIYNFLWSIVKIVFGAFQASYLYCLSGSYTLLIGFSKKIFISNHSKQEVINKSTKSTIMGVLILISGLAFGLYMGRLFFIPQDYEYGMIWSISIALCSFVELGIAIYNLCKIRKKNDILLSSLRLCNLTSAIFAIVITQVAILSATGTPDTAQYNGITGIVAGALTVAIGTYIIIRSANKNQNKNSLSKTSSETKHEEEKSEEIENAKQNKNTKENNLN